MTRDEVANLSSNAILWDDLDEAIIGLAKRTDFGPLVVYDTTGEISIKLEEEFYETFEEDEDRYDSWDRPTFEGVVVYDTTKVLGILMANMEVDESELFEGETIETAKYMMALEYFDYNIAGGFVGPMTPIHLILESPEELI
jgi:hypothetical protein